MATAHLIILDDGFFLRENRVRYVELSNAAGARAKIQLMDTHITVIRARLEERNAKLPRYNFQY
jgi:predicted kinase